MVRGLAIAVTAVAFTYQCAETTRMARGRGMLLPKLRHAVEYRLISSAFIGLPCPKNTAGIGVGVAAGLGLKRGGKLIHLSDNDSPGPRANRSSPPGRLRQNHHSGTARPGQNDHPGPRVRPPRSGTPQRCQQAFESLSKNIGARNSRGYRQVGPCAEQT